MNMILPLAAMAAPMDATSALRAGTEEICDQLCAVVTGDFGFRVETTSDDETAQKLAMLSNFVLDAARRAVEATRVARIGTWWQDLATGQMTMSDEMHHLLGTDPSTFHPTLPALLALIHADDRHAATAAFARDVVSTAVLEHEWRVLRADGAPAWFWAETRIETDIAGHPAALRGVCQDVTERRATAERIYKLAHHDTLTDLANRTLLNERLSEAVARARRSGTTLAVLCIDLDGFKAINDLHGHAAGDSLLREVARRLGRDVRQNDLVARLGGDEFVVLQDAPAPPDAARLLADRLVSVLAEPYELDVGVQGCVTTSVGVALFPEDGATPDRLLHNADTALYQAKRAGKNGSAFFRPGMDLELRRLRELEHDLRQAASRGEFMLAWQPLAAAAEDGCVNGFEVLLRWRHPACGLVPPDVFIPVAEASGAITGIGAWVLRQACFEAASWAAPLRIAVNVSPIQVQQGAAFAEMVEEVLAASGLDPTRLELEVTEGVLVHDTDRVLLALRRLKLLGVRVALDDFGTGYSSLATLRAFPFDKIKIDKSFISNIALGGQDAAIVRAVVGLAHGLGLPVVAEGVETEAQLSALRHERCEEVQGWLTGRPAAIESFAHLTGKPSDTADEDR